MTQERIIETRTLDGETVSRHTLITESSDRLGKGWLLLLVLLVAAVAALFMLNTVGDAEIAKDNAVASAANEVGEAANKVGTVAQDAVDKLGGE